MISHPSEAASWAQECVRKTGGRNLILSAGGGVSPGTLPETIDALARVAGQDLVEDVAGLEDFLGLDLDVGDLPAHLAVRLVDHHLGVRQGETLALRAAGQEHRLILTVVAACGNSSATVETPSSLRMP